MEVITGNIFRAWKGRYVIFFGLLESSSQKAEIPIEILNSVPRMRCCQSNQGVSRKLCNALVLSRPNAFHVLTLVKDDMFPVVPLPCTNGILPSLYLSTLSPGIGNHCWERSFMVVIAGQPS